MNKEKKIEKFPSELRLDKTSKDWVVIATGRAKRPEMFKKERRKEHKVSKKDCPFCNLSNKESPILAYFNGSKIPIKDGNIPKKWTTISIPNKYPAFVPSEELDRKKENGFFERMNAVGYHEVIVTLDHEKSLALLPKEHIKEVIDVYVDRYKDLLSKKIVNYVAIFHNHGAEAGASIYHPHSQIIALPLIDSDLEDALERAKKFKKTKSCIYCKLNKWELEKKERIVYENDDYIAVCPFASKAAFQVIISPKKHLAFFEKITEKEKVNLADIIRIVLAKLHKGLGDPAFNFYLHAAPSDGQDHSYYHWHWTILPKTSIWAGFELGVGIEISTIEPEKAAEYLRNQKI